MYRTLLRHNVRALLAPTLALVVVSSTGVQPAIAATAAIVPSPNAEVTYESELSDVSCVTGTACWAVGTARESESDSPLPLVLRLSGPTWSRVDDVPLPPGAGNPALRGVSCINTGNCKAVGSVEIAGRTRSMIVRWNGTDWKPMYTPQPGGASASRLLDISCTATNNCRAVGYWCTGDDICEEQWGTGTRRGLLMRWNGTDWAVVPTPNPSGSTGVEIFGISCPTSTACLAVGGWYSVFPVYKSFVLRLSGTTRTIVPAPNPAGSVGSTLYNVACSSASLCRSVGESGVDLQRRKTMVQRWNGINMAVVATPNPSGASQSALRAVSCVTAADCKAVGQTYNSTSAVTRTLAERWNGTNWAIPATPNPTGSTYTTLTGLACTSTTLCWAVGRTSKRPVIQRWNGTGWALVAIPPVTGPGETSFYGVSCPSAGVCWAVGDSGSNQGEGYTTQRNFLARWNGSGWQSVAVPLPSGATGSGLADVACVTTTDCWAIGSKTVSGGERTVIVRWNGTAWTIVTSPNPTGSDDAMLSGISCSSATDCWAVGGSQSASAYRSLTMHWNGGAWTIVTSPNPTGSESSLSDVTCPAISDCWAVGGTATASAYQPLTMHWNGTAWAIVTSPNPTGSKSYLSDVTCPAISDCWAVGGSWTASVSRPLTMHWNGTAWAIVTSPKPTGSDAASLDGAVCTVSSDCWAVGVADDGAGVDRALILHWNGTAWSIFAGPSPAGTRSWLYAVTCTPVGTCWGVGEQWTGSTSDRTLTVRLVP